MKKNKLMQTYPAARVALPTTGKNRLAALATGLVLGLAVATSVQAQSMIGRWITGSEDLTDKSGFTTAGTHDGVAIGTPGNVTFTSADVPPGFTGSSLYLAGGAAVMVTNSANTDSNFVQTFNTGISNKFSTVFWFKGTPGGWNPLVSKAGESGIGWQARQLGWGNQACFTIRGTVGNDDPGGANNTLFTDGNWHHMAATWDGVTGQRKLYVDGVLDISLSGDFAPMALAPQDHLILGGRQVNGGGFGNWFTGGLADVRVYNYALSAGEVVGIYNPPTTSIVSLVNPKETNRWVGMTVNMDIIIPVAATASGSYTVTAKSSSDAVMGFQGFAGDTRTLTFGQGVVFTNITLVATGAGTATVTCSGSSYTSSTDGFTVYAQNAPALVGHWFTGTADLADKSGYTPAGTHDGFAVNTNSAVESFVSDVPPGKTGQSLSLPGDVAIAITNSVNTNGNYLQTFDANMAVKQTVAFWAKGMPGDWNPWVSKRGENDRGFRIGRHGGSDNATYTLRGTPGDDDKQGTRNVNNTDWHHFAGTWDGNTGIRKFYVDGLLQYTIANDFAPLTMAPESYLVLGGIDQDGFGRYLVGQLYDVRLYNYALTEVQVGDLASTGVALTPVATSILANLTNSLRITIPSSANASASATVYVTNNAPTVADLPGSTANVLAVVFPAGTTPIQSITVNGLAAGTASYSASAAGLNSGAGTFTVTPDTRILLGQWFTGAEDFDNKSGYLPGVHNGIPQGGYAFATNDVPVGYTGSCLDLAGIGAVVIDNSYTTNSANYQPTFDDTLKSGFGFAMTFWMKGWGSDPGTWWYTPFITKNTGNWDTGYGVRGHTDDNNAAEFHLGGVDRWWNGPKPSIQSNNGKWHHYAAVFDPSGVKRIYVDGVLSKEQTCGVNFSISRYSALVIGGVDENTGGQIIGNMGKCKFFDVRMYGKAISQYDIYGMTFPSTTHFALEMNYPSMLVGQSGSITVRAPFGLNATQPVTIYLTNSSPGVLTINGSSAAIIPITFAAGALPYTNLTIAVVSAGAINLSVGGSGMVSAAVSGVASTPALVGRWLSGSQNLTDVSGYTPAGTHDGTAMGGTPSFYVFSTNVPPGFVGHSLDLTTNGQACFFPDSSPMTNADGSQLYGEVAVAIGNSATNAAGYLNTFDNALSVNCSISFWVQGVPGGWQPFVSKHGEDGLGYQVRRGGGTASAFTVRGTSNQDGVGSGDITTNAAWYHVAAVRDAVTGIRKLYVDGVQVLNLTGDTAVGTLAPGQRLVLGAMERNGWSSGYFSGLLYDVRVYNYALNASQVASLMVPPAVLGIDQPDSSHIVVSWPAALTGYVLQTNTALPGVWGDSTLPVTTVNGQNVVTDTLTSGPRFYRLKK